MELRKPRMTSVAELYEIGHPGRMIPGEMDFRMYVFPKHSVPLPIQLRILDKRGAQREKIDGKEFWVVEQSTGLIPDSEKSRLREHVYAEALKIDEPVMFSHGSRS